VTPNTHARPEHAASRRRRLAWRLGTPIVLVACGALFVVSAIDSDGTDLRPGRYTSLSSLVQAEAHSYHQLQHQVTTLRQQVATMTNDVHDNTVRRYQRHVAKLKGPAGLTPVEGPGVTVRLADAPTSLIDSTTLNPNLLVVHQQDIQAVVNALWRGGATAITIQGQRIVSTTGIKCAGSTVQLQGVPYPEPYVIRAVGDPTQLEDALDDDSYVSIYRQQAANPQIDIGWRMGVDADIKAPAFQGLTEMTYASPTTQPSS